MGLYPRFSYTELFDGWEIESMYEGEIKFLRKLDGWDRDKIQVIIDLLNDYRISD